MDPLPAEPRDDVDRIASLVDSYARTIAAIGTLAASVVDRKFSDSLLAALHDEQARIAEFQTHFRVQGPARIQLLSELQNHGLTGDSLKLKLRVAGDSLSYSLSEAALRPPATLGSFLGVEFQWDQAYFNVKADENTRALRRRPSDTREPWWHRIPGGIKRWIDRADPVIDSALDVVPIIGPAVKEFKDIVKEVL